MSTLLRSFALTATFAVAFAIPASSNVEDFSGFPAGTVVSGDLPQGGTAASGSFFTSVEVSSVTNNAGPNSVRPARTARRSETS